MPIGKNSLKRVANNGYSKVKTEAPDMENSNIIANPDPQVMALLTKEEVSEKPTVKKEAKAPVKKKTAPTKKKTATATKKPTAKETKEPTSPDGFIRVGVGKDLPYYLL